MLSSLLSFSVLSSKFGNILSLFLPFLCWSSSAFPACWCQYPSLPVLLLLVYSIPPGLPWGPLDVFPICWASSLVCLSLPTTLHSIIFLFLVSMFSSLWSGVTWMLLTSFFSAYGIFVGVLYIHSCSTGLNPLVYAPSSCCCVV